MRSVLLNYLIFIGVTVQAQVSDTIFTFKEKIGCVVKEVGVDLVNYSYPNEEVVNVLPKSQVNRIVYKNGREKIINSDPLIKSVRYVVDWQNVRIASDENEVLGLTKCEELNSTFIDGSIGFGVKGDLKNSYDGVTSKIKKYAAMRGYNIVLASFNRNEFRTIEAVAKIQGPAYDQSLPSLEQLKSKTKSTSNFRAIFQYKLYKNNLDSGAIKSTLIVSKTYEQNGMVYFTGKINSLSGDFRLVYVGPSFFVVHFAGFDTEYNFEVSYE